MEKIIIKIYTNQKNRTRHDQITKSNHYTTDEYIKELKLTLNERNSAILIQICDDKIIKYIVYIDWLTNHLTDNQKRQS